MVAVAWKSPNFSDPRYMLPITYLAADARTINSSLTAVTLDTTAGFTGLAQFGLQDNTDWTANTYKTIYSHTGMGFLLALIGPTAGAAATTTFELTIDGVLREITVTNAGIGERAILLSSPPIRNGADFTTASSLSGPLGIYDAGLTTIQASSGRVLDIVTQRSAAVLSAPLLEYRISCLIRMKHSASITNSVATAYSAIIVRKAIAA